MKVRRFLILLLLGLHAPPGGSLSAQETPAEPKPVEVPTFGVSAAAVTLDVVVRDKKGNVVHDLKPSDFEIYEDGVRQSVESFEIFGRPPVEVQPAEAPPVAPSSAVVSPSATAPAVSAPTPVAPEAADPAARPHVIAFVFDRLSAEARTTAHKASLVYANRGHISGDLVGVFSIDLALRTIQPFTTELDLVRAGLDRAASQGNTAFGNSRADLRDLVDTIDTGSRIAEGASGVNPGQGGSASDVGGAAASGAIAAAVATAQAGMLRNFQALERDQQGYASTNGLLAVVSGLKSLPGRKTVIFFSEGLAIPANVQAQFRAVIASANRSNVSVYAMDAAGLRAQSMLEETRKEMQQASMRRLRQVESGRDDASDGIMSRNLERNEDLLRLHPESGLGQLASETGGFLIRDTNDAASAFRRIEEDMRFHYLIGYSPSNENYDGKFRAISVKVKRPGLRVQTRQGYVAIRTAESVPLRSFEAPVLALLEKKNLPRQFPLQAAGLSFPMESRPGLAPVLVHVPGNTISYALDKDDQSGQKLHRADFAIVVRVRNEAGQEVDRLSQHYLLSAPAGSLQAARAGDLLFYRETDLMPGRYTLEAIGYDAIADRASVGTAELEIGAAQEGRPRLSSVVVVGRAEKARAGEVAGGNPLFYEDTIIYPNMGEPFRKSTSPALGFFFTLYGVKGQTPSKATIEVFRDDKSAGQVTAELPAADASGRVQYAGALPLQSFPAGFYKLKVTAMTGSGFDSRQASFTVTE